MISVMQKMQTESQNTVIKMEFTVYLNLTIKTREIKIQKTEFVKKYKKIKLFIEPCVCTNLCVKSMYECFHTKKIMIINNFQIVGKALIWRWSRRILCKSLTLDMRLFRILQIH